MVPFVPVRRTAHNASASPLPVSLVATVRGAGTLPAVVFRREFDGETIEAQRHVAAALADLAQQHEAGTVVVRVFVDDPDEDRLPAANASDWFCAGMIARHNTAGLPAFEFYFLRSSAAAEHCSQIADDCRTFVAPAADLFEVGRRYSSSAVGGAWPSIGRVVDSPAMRDRDVRGRASPICFASTGGAS